MKRYKGWTSEDSAQRLPFFPRQAGKCKGYCSHHGCLQCGKCTYAGKYSGADFLDVRDIRDNKIRDIRLKVEMKKFRPFYYGQI